MNGPVITLIDYGGSNLRSVQKAFETVGAAVRVATRPEDVARADRLVLPGVGAFGAGMAALRAAGLVEETVAAVNRGTPLLGICLGMQLLFDASEELGRHAGLRLLGGRVVRFNGQSAFGRRLLKVPHVGWNELIHDSGHPLLDGVPTGAHAYFVHSYYCAADDPAVVLSRSDYGLSFPAIVGRGRVFGFQFHPEKSQSVGLRLLRNFATLEIAV